VGAECLILPLNFLNSRIRALSQDFDAHILTLILCLRSSENDVLFGPVEIFLMMLMRSTVVLGWGECCGFVGAGGGCE